MKRLFPLITEEGTWLLNRVQENTVEFQTNLPLLFKYFVAISGNLTLPSLISLKIKLSEYLITIISEQKFNLNFHKGTYGSTDQQNPLLRYIRAFLSFSFFLTPSIE